MATFRISVPLLLAAGFLLAAAAAVRPQTALALTLETPPAAPGGSASLSDPDQPLSRLSGKNLSDPDGDGSNGDQPHGLTFGSPGNGFSFSVGPTQGSFGSYRSDPFHNDRFFRPGPPTDPNR